MSHAPPLEKLGKMKGISLGSSVPLTLPTTVASTGRSIAPTRPPPQLWLYAGSSVFITALMSVYKMPWEVLGLPPNAAVGTDGRCAATSCFGHCC